MAHERIKPEFLFDEVKIEQLKQIAPECFEDGKINFETLRQNLGDWAQDEEDGDVEHFGLSWPGKKDARRLATLPPEGTLEPVYGEGLKADGTPDDDGVNDSKNIFIEGENLEVLKILQKSYANRIKMIYIDPPYNTGNDFVYDDDFTEPLQEYLRRTGQIDEEGKPLTTNKKSDGRFHSKWLSMMYPRLRLARNLLKEDGVIFVSIDDNEVHNLRAIMNEIFGEENFVANIIWQKKFSRSNDAAYFSTMHDNIVCYSKTSIRIDSEKGWKLNLIDRSEEIPAGYSNPDNDSRGYWTSVVLSAKSGSDKLKYHIKTPSGRDCAPPDGRFWSVSESKFEELKIDNRIWFGKNGDGIPRLKTFLNEVQSGLRPNSIWFHEDVGHNQEGRQEVKALFDDKGVFDGPKPVRLLKHIIHLASNENDFIALDFFAGSGTLAHAILEKNSEDRGTRSFISVQMPELIEESHIGKSLGYNSIADISSDRIKRVIKAQKLKDGFKSFKLRRTNYKKWNDFNGSDITNLENSLDLFNSSPLRDDWNKNKLITELMLIEGFPLDSSKNKSMLSSNEIVKIESEMVPNKLLICLDDEIDEGLIEELNLDSTSMFICLDSAISNQNKLRLSDKGLIKTI